MSLCQCTLLLQLLTLADTMKTCSTIVPTLYELSISNHIWQEMPYPEDEEGGGSLFLLSSHLDLRDPATPMVRLFMAVDGPRLYPPSSVKGDLFCHFWYAGSLSSSFSSSSLSVLATTAATNFTYIRFRPTSLRHSNVRICQSATRGKSQISWWGYNEICTLC